MTIRTNLNDIEEQKARAAERSGRKADDVLLVAVTKLHGTDEINEAIDCGVTDIGENKVQEILEKYESVKPVRWHLIGHLQRNKVKYIIDKVSMIHSVDSVRLAEEINKEAEKHGISMDILLQVNTAEEESKFGLTKEETEGVLDEILEKCGSLRVRGLMCIAPFEEDPENTRGYFRMAKELYDRLGAKKHENIDFKYLSMGMSNDFEVAIEEGSNLIRVGTSIFGERDYTK